jgi:nitric oxide reductase NorQ protein
MSAAANSYICRKYHDKADVEILMDAIKARQNSLLLGPRGTGKSSLANEAAKRLKREYCYVPCHTGATPEALIGQWIPNPSGAGYIWMDGVLTRAVRVGKVCLLDEINSLKPEVAFAIHGLLDHRRELILTDKPDANGEPEVVTAHPNFGLLAAGNPFYEGVRVMNEAFRDRFAVQLHLGYHTELDVAILRGDNSVAKLDAKQAVALEQFIAKVRNSVKNKAINSDVSTRAFLDLAENMAVHTFQTARTMFLTRFNDDDAEVTAIRTCFNDVWSAEGKPLSVTDAQAEVVTKGRAGRFAAKGSKLGEGTF